MTIPQRARRVIAIAITVDLLAAWVFDLTEHVGFGNSLYWSIVTGTTVGYGDIVPHGWAPKLVAIMVCLTVIPLLASVFALVTSGLTSDKVNAHHDSLHSETIRHLRHMIDNLPDELVPPMPEETT